MSQIQAVTAAIEDMAGRLSGIAPGTSEFHGQVIRHATAAADTPAHEAMTGLMARWATALPRFAEAGDRLQAAMDGAAQAYARSDAAVAARGGERRAALVSIPADPGVSAPTGDPASLLAAASWHENLSGFFESTATTLQFTVGSLSGANWSGEAASSYQSLAGLVIGHFRQAAATASAAAEALRRYGSKLDQLQREGVAAVQQVVHWMTLREADQKKLQKAQADVKAAQNAVSDTQAAQPGASRRSRSRRRRSRARRRRSPTRSPTTLRFLPPTPS